MAARFFGRRREPLRVACLLLMRADMNLLRAVSLGLCLFALAGCSCTSRECVRAVRCVTACGEAPVAEGCIACPDGSFDDLVCRDASTDDGGADASTTDAELDSGTDAGATEEDASGPDASTRCPPESYVATSTPTRDQRLVVEAAAAALETATGVSVTLHAETAAVTSFSGPLALENDDSIADPCDRAFASWLSFVDSHDALMRMPDDMHVRACHVDDLTGRAVVRISGGTYDGRILVGANNDLVIHVSPEGVLHYFGGDYLPVAQRGFPEPCLTPEELAETLFGDTLGYTRFEACVIRGTGMIAIRPGDTLNVGEPALFVDDAGGIHAARRIEVLLEPSHVTAEAMGSDLYCCFGSLEGCVGAWVIVDELSFEILAQSPRCTTC